MEMQNFSIHVVKYILYVVKYILYVLTPKCIGVLSINFQVVQETPF